MSKDRLTKEERALAIKLWSQLGDVTIARGKIILKEVMVYANELTKFVEETSSIKQIRQSFGGK